MPKRTSSVIWEKKPDKHDYPAAESYLSLIYAAPRVTALVKALEKARMTAFKAKDIFRASALPILGSENFHVRRNIKKMREGIRLSPLLLVRDEVHARLIIADGYHRMCSVYLSDEDAEVPCKIV